MPVEETEELLWSQVLFFLVWFLASLVAFYRLGYFKITKDKPPAFITLWQTLGAFTIFLLSYIVLIPLLGKVTYLPVRGDLVGIFVFALLLALFCFYCRGSIGVLLKPKDFLGGLGLGAFTWLLAAPLVLLWSEGIKQLLLFWGVPPTDQSAVQALKDAFDNPFLFWSLTAFIVTVVPFVEEILFRGFLQNSLRPYLGKVGTTLIVAAIFAFFHFAPDQGLSNATILSSLYILALFLGFLMEKTRTLWAPIGLHMTFNAISVMMLILQDKGVV